MMRAWVSALLTGEQAVRMRAWISALRSGLYRQTKRALRNTVDLDGNLKAYCCLGVAVEEAIAAGCPNVKWEGDTLHHVLPFGTTATSAQLPVEPVVRWYGFNTAYAKIRVECRALGKRDYFSNRCRFMGPDPDGHNFATCTEIVAIGATALNDVYGWTFHQIADAFEKFYFAGQADETQ